MSRIPHFYGEMKTEGKGLQCQIDEIGGEESSDSQVEETPYGLVLANYLPSYQWPLAIVAMFLLTAKGGRRGGAKRRKDQDTACR